MKNYNKAERRISQFLNNTPLLKHYLKYFYQLLNYLIFRNKNEYDIEVGIELKQLSKNKYFESFFGYYDKSPVNDTNKYLIFHNSLAKTSKKPSSENKIEIHIKEFMDNTIIDKIKTPTYNWQQGAKTQWIDNNKFIYNSFDGEKYISNIYDIINKRIERKINFPVYDCYGDKFALSLNYERLAKLRPDYGYYNNENKTDINDIKNDGIFYIDFTSRKYKLLIPIETVAKDIDDYLKYSHFFNHIMISPKGNKFIFLHRYFSKNGRRFDRLMISGIDGKDIRCLSEDDMVSHCAWKNNDEIIGWMRKEAYGDHYYLIKESTNQYEIVGKDILTEDGHPSISNDEKWLLTDTYPDKARMSKLLLYNLETKNLIKLGEFYSPMKFHGVNRCDLHPRFNPGYKKITFDSVHTGIRQLYEMDISKILNHG